MRQALTLMWWDLTNWLYNKHQDLKEWFRGMPEEDEDRLWEGSESNPKNRPKKEAEG